MRKIYQKYFALPEEGKGIMSECVFFARLAVSIVCIVLCMGAMGFTAYAYFTASVSSSMNQIQAANYSLSVQSIEIVPVNESGSVVADESNPTKYRLQKGMYDFTLKKSGNASTGYCKIKVNNNENAVAVTRQIADGDLKVRIEVAQETVVEFVACWGTYSNEDRFDEKNTMIVVDSDNKVNITVKLDARTVSSTTNIPVVTSEPTTTTQSEQISTPSETQDVSQSGQVVPKENTNTTEDSVQETEQETEQETQQETEEEKIEYSQENY